MVKRHVKKKIAVKHHRSLKLSRLLGFTSVFFESKFSVLCKKKKKF